MRLICVLLRLVERNRRRRRQRRLLKAGHIWKAVWQRPLEAESHETFGGYARGGVIPPSQSGAYADKIPVILSDGYIIRPEQAERHRRLLEQLNRTHESRTTPTTEGEATDGR